MPNSPDPTLDSGNADDEVLPCQRNDLEVVGDLEEPNTIEFESGPEDDPPAAIVFAAVAQEPDGKALRLSGEGHEDEEDVAEDDDNE